MKYLFVFMLDQNPMVFFQFYPYNTCDKYNLDISYKNRFPPWKSLLLVLHTHIIGM